MMNEEFLVFHFQQCQIWEQKKSSLVAFNYTWSDATHITYA